MDNSPVRLSKWAWVDRRPQATAVFHSLKLSLVFFEPRYASLLEELRCGAAPSALAKHGEDVPAMLEELSRIGLVVPIGHDDDETLRSLQERYVGKPSLETMFMLLTDACNLRCRYCLINCNMPDSCPGNSMMSWETARDAVDMYFANLKPNGFQKTIVFYGGEPLTNFQLLTRIVEYIETAHAAAFAEHKVSPLIITNGTRITDPIAGYFASHPEIGVCVSLDGDKEAHDGKRVYPDGSGTFDDVMAGIGRLRAAGRRDINISATIDDHNIERLDSLLALHKEHGFQTVNFNLLLDTFDREVPAEYTERATQKMISYFEQARQIGLHEDRIMRKVRCLSRGVVHPFDCRATGQQVAVAPDGSIGVCHEGLGCKGFFFGKASKDFVFDAHPLIQEWSHRSPLAMPQCWSCPALGLCGGGCAYSAHLRHGSIWGIDDKFCKHSLTVLEWLIWDVHSRM